MMAAATRLFAASNWDGPLSALRCEAAALSFFADALTDLNDDYSRKSARIDLRKLERVKDELDCLSALAEVRLNDLAARHDMSVRSLSRHFKAAFGATITNYILANRMDQARAALERGELTIDQAAHIAGFSHTSNFSRAFNRYFGYSPSAVSGRVGLSDL